MYSMQCQWSEVRSLAFGYPDRGRHASLPSRDGKRARAPRRATSFPLPHPPFRTQPPFFPGGPGPHGPAQRAHATGASSATSPPTTRGAHRTRDAPRPRGAAWRAPRPRRAPPLRFTRGPCARRQAATGEGGGGGVGPRRARWQGRPPAAEAAGRARSRGNNANVGGSSPSGLFTKKWRRRKHVFLPKQTLHRHARR